ncbi:MULTISPECIES: dephospho-CoA kinase [unclassified Bacillus (in: firmicutes)]|uniref:dephospho-CoA kinase n=1 Tax=unclassified Bacillus (in: firmicutes) TaxID=185979 RepID=UPI00080AEC71|nr:MULTISPECIES: dephospho-CoA kinase [unclassified Bacillus (in: firmicutes)]OCA81808.1 dephospho-CoA kinase [Bacillus sp. FJAT-27986]
MGKIFGVTGGIASGKSSVSKWLISKGYPVIDADIAARKVVEPGMPALEEIKNVFGQDICLPDGTLDRKKLGSIVFSNSEKRQMLNGIVHPAVRKWMMEETEKALHQGKELVFMDIPLLFESNLTHMVEGIILVYVKPEVQLKRLMARDHFTEEEALARIRAQMPIDDKKKLADYIVDNNGEFFETEEQLIDLIKQLNV